MCNGASSATTGLVLPAPFCLQMNPHQQAAKIGHRCILGNEGDAQFPARHARDLTRCEWGAGSMPSGQVPRQLQPGPAQPQQAGSAGAPPSPLHQHSQQAGMAYGAQTPSNAPEGMPQHFTPTAPQVRTTLAHLDPSELSQLPHTPIDRHAIVHLSCTLNHRRLQLPLASLSSARSFYEVRNNC